jgi:hypothetical protein
LYTLNYNYKTGNKYGLLLLLQLELTAVASTGQVYGIGHNIANGNFVATLNSFSTSNGRSSGSKRHSLMVYAGIQKQIGLVQGPWVGFGSVGAIDVDDNLYYALLAADAFSPFQLVGLSLNDATTVNAPLLCGLETCKCFSSGCVCASCLSCLVWQALLVFKLPILNINRHPQSQQHKNIVVENLVYWF